MRPEKKKRAISYRILPLSAVLIAFLISFFTIFFTSDQMVERLRASEAVDSLRFKIEQYRFEHGAYPESLDVISKRADPWGRPYIYVRNDYTFMVFSAGADGGEGTSDDIY